ncbi:hypothetical protein [Nonomuraea sp. NPDC049028]|uniref:hypothetical protein n=1 Tax=Nonomuraea sp. NPDC049028 TaxID=3364348 RepID=UPI003718664D
MQPEHILNPGTGMTTAFTTCLSPYRITPNMSEQIDDKAFELGLSKSEVVRYALSYAFEHADWRNLSTLKKEYRETRKKRALAKKG